MNPSPHLEQRQVPGQRRQWIRPIIIFVLAGVAVGLGLWWQRAALESTARLPVVPAPAYDSTWSQRWSPSVTTVNYGDVRPPAPIRIRRGETPIGLLQDLGLDRREAHTAVQALAEHVDLRRMRAGEEGEAWFDASDRLMALELRVAGQGRVELTRQGDGWESRWHEITKEIHVQRVEGELTDFLESAIIRGGGLPQLSVAMSLVLQWDLDFNRDLRIGDRFRVVYEEIWLDGERGQVGNILALTYENRDRRLEAYRYGDEGGYYDAEGRPLRKLFLRSPLPFTRVTSRFSKSRYHPVLKKYRPHYGVDYGAPSGTPVRATASGVVTFAARKGQAGKMVKVRHPNGYVTAYLHLSGFARGLHSGKRVAQGEVIGYVGSTGLSTGPHLDYRVQKNGRWIDPLSLKSEPAPPIAEDELMDFLAARDELRRSLGGEGEARSYPDERRSSSVGLDIGAAAP